MVKHGCSVNKPIFNWELGSVKDCHAFLLAIRPYTIEKREQVELAIEWLEYRLLSPLFGTRPPVDIERANETHIRFQRLKREPSELSGPLSAPVFG